jgi:transposase
MTNGPIEALNNLIKRIKRVGFGFRNFENYRIHALLYAGKPNWRVLGSIVVR